MQLLKPFGFAGVGESPAPRLRSRGGRRRVGPHVDGTPLTRTQHDRAAALDDIGELRDQVEKILTSLTGQDATSPAEWFWLTMSDQIREEKLGELHDWVETVYREHYPDYLAQQIKPCWPNHPEARWELAWLYQQWTLTYLAQHPAPKDAADWHDRWSPRVLRRLAAVMSHCDPTCQRRPGRSAFTL